MQLVVQQLEDILASLQPLEVDATAIQVVEQLRAIPVKTAYSTADVQALLDGDFDAGILICRLFMGLCEDQFTALLNDARGDRGVEVNAYHADRAGFMKDFLSIGLLEAMAAEANRKAHWSDVLIERLRSGRDSGSSVQRRGRNVEELAESIIKKVFGHSYEARRTFNGPHGTTAKCDFAVPSKRGARILIESKAYGAAGRAMADILRDLHTIIGAKRGDTALLFLTDGLAWKERQTDLRQIVDLQNDGYIARIYTQAMSGQFEKDLRELKREAGL